MKLYVVLFRGSEFLLNKLNGGVAIISCEERMNRGGMSKVTDINMESEVDHIDWFRAQ